MINCLPVTSRKLNERSNLNPEVGARCRQAVTSLWRYVEKTPVELAPIEKEIAEARRRLDDWLTESYRGREDQKFYGENDASYPDWAGIEDIVGSVFDLRAVGNLSPAAIDSLLFFISRSDECGRILAWLGLAEGSSFSNCGDLDYGDFLTLAEQAAGRADDHCDYQIVSCFQLCGGLDSPATAVLHQFFEKKDSYTRRMVVQVLARFRSPETIDFVRRLWRSDDCEFAKLTCLHALKGVAGAESEFRRLLDEYQETFDVAAEDYRQSHMQQLTEATAT